MAVSSALNNGSSLFITILKQSWDHPPPAVPKPRPFYGIYFRTPQARPLYGRKAKHFMYSLVYEKKKNSLDKLQPPVSFTSKERTRFKNRQLFFCDADRRSNAHGGARTH